MEPKTIDRMATVVEGEHKGEWVFVLTESPPGTYQCDLGETAERQQPKTINLSSAAVELWSQVHSVEVDQDGDALIEHLDGRLELRLAESGK